VGSKESAVKKYIVTLSDAEREKLNEGNAEISEISGGRGE
jgi:hypothetical protein